MNKILTLSLWLLASIGLNMSLNNPVFAQVSEQISQLSSHDYVARAEGEASQTVLLGKVLSANQFRKITQYSNSKVISNPIDFCVGMIDDEEQALSLEGINYRQYQNQYAIDQIIFVSRTQNFKVLFDSIVLDKNTRTNHIKKLKAEVIAHVEKGHLIDGLSHHQYPYTSRYSIRKRNQDELIYAYFNHEKLIGLQHIMQC